TLGLLAASAAALLAAGAHRLLGYYRGATRLHDPGAALHWAATDSLLLCFATGVVLVPAALACLATEVVRPADRRTGAFAALALTTSLALLAEAAVYAANGTGRFQERYLMALLPLV